MQKVNYKLSVAGWSIDSSDDPRTELLSLETSAAVGSPAGVCRIVVYAPPAAKPSLLEQAIGAVASAVGLGGAAAPPTFSIDIRGEKVTYGDRVSLSLSAGDKSAVVMATELRSIRSSLGESALVGRTGGHRLVTTRLNQVYQNQTAGQIGRDLASQAGVDAGDIDDGATYAYLVVHESRNVWSHVRDLAAHNGLDVYFDDANRLTLKKFQKTSADHTLYYGIDILTLDLLNVEPWSEHVFVYGESASSNTGADTWSWVAKDMQPFRGEAGKGAKLQGVSHASLRTKAAAGTFATSRLGAITDGATIGRLTLLGDPTMKLGESIEIKEATKPELNGIFKVTAVRHVYSKRDGFVTTLGFSGKGGAEQAGGALGQLAGALAGAVGL